MTTELSPDRMLLHYRLVEELGQGGMGVVWKAVDTTLDREVAVKVLPAAFAADAERLTRFEREAKTLASLNHPNIAAVFGLHESEGLRFLAMELVRGRTLTEEIAHGLSPQRVLDLAVGIADGLAAAHQQSVVHRDLKPDNVVVGADRRPKILDFGLAKSGQVTGLSSDVTATATATQAGTLLGTVAYMSPEQAQGKPVDARSDVFALGIVLYEMATGRRPFAGDNAVSILTSILRDTPQSISRSRPAAATPLDRVVRRCLEKKPEDRYADAGEVHRELLALRDGAAPRRSKAFWIATGATAVLLLAVAGTWQARRAARASWLSQDAWPQLEATVDRIQALNEGRESWDAWVLSRRIEDASPGDPRLERLRGKFAREITIVSDPPGAAVTARYYDDTDAPPVKIGTTPLEGVWYPRGFSRVRLALPGRPPLDDVILNSALVGERMDYRFSADGEVPEGMSLVPAGEFPMFLPGLDHLKAEPTTSFAIDRSELTNAAFKRFVDAGGYADAKYWRVPFRDGAKTLSFPEAMARFVDTTGRPGPAGWEVGSYPKDRGDHPVSGVSWYEAAAYAEWAGRRLPTVFHWNRVAFTVASARVVPMSNLGGSDTVPAGGTKSENRFGVYDLAGNVREWTWNGSHGEEERYILGGGYSDPDYAFVDAYAQPAFDRSATNGFRCILPLDPEGNAGALERPIDRPRRDFFAEKPVPDEVFSQYLRQFAYDRAPLDARIEEELKTPEGVRQKISFNAAYGGERMTAYLFLPPSGTKPYPTVVEFPGSGSITTRSSASLELGRLDFLPRSGRAVLWPIYKGTYERGGEMKSDYPEMTAAYKDYVIMWAKDLGRSIDYLETRDDLDTKHLAYYGLSWGGALGGILPAVEPRIKVNVLYVAGLGFQHALPEVDVIHYIGRVRQPTLILNGELDFFFPPDSQRAMFDLLGTPPADKKRLVFPGGHSVPRTETIRESLAWLDRYQKPPRQ